MDHDDILHLEALEFMRQAPTTKPRSHGLPENIFPVPPDRGSARAKSPGMNS